MFILHHEKRKYEHPSFSCHLSVISPTWSLHFSNVNMEIDVCKWKLIRFLIVHKDQSVSNHWLRERGFSSMFQGKETNSDIYVFLAQNFIHNNHSWNP